jgi:hypothetical protein
MRTVKFRPSQYLDIPNVSFLQNIRLLLVDSYEPSFQFLKINHFSYKFVVNQWLQGEQMFHCDVQLFATGIRKLN